MEFITTGNRIAVENFSIGKIYTITWETGNYKSLACTGKGTDFVMFQDQEPDLLFCLTMDSAITVSSIEEGGGGSGTMNYNELENKPSINGFVLVGNKTGAELGLASQSDLEDYATNASLVAGLAGKQDALSSSQLAAVNSGITSADVAQITTNKSNILSNENSGYLQNYNLSTLVGGTTAGAGEIEKRACNLAAGTYYISWVSTATSGSTVMTFYAGGAQIKQEGFTNSTSRQEKVITLSQACDEIQLYTNTANTVSEVMISITANKPYIPYAPSNAELYQMILANQ